MSFELFIGSPVLINGYEKFLYVVEFYFCLLIE